EVEDDLLDFFVVGLDGGEVVAGFQAELDALALGEGGDEAEEPLAGLVQVHGGDVEDGLAGFDAGHLQEAVDQVEEVAAGGVDVGADSQVALADFFGGFLQRADGAEDDLVGDQVEDQHGKAQDDEAGGEQVGAVDGQEADGLDGAALEKDDPFEGVVGGADS